MQRSCAREHGALAHRTVAFGQDLPKGCDVGLISKRRHIASDSLAPIEDVVTQWLYAAIKVGDELGIEPKAHSSPLILARQPSRRWRHLFQPARVVAEPMRKCVDKGHYGQSFGQARQPIADSYFQGAQRRTWPQVPPEILQRLDCVASLKRAAQLPEFPPGMHDVGLPCRRQRFVCGGTARSEPGVLTLPKRRAR